MTRLRRADDDGSLLVLALVLIVRGGFLVLPLLVYATTVVRAGDVTGARNRRVEAARAGVQLAIALQREVLASQCVQGATGGLQVNGMTVDISCADLGTLDSQSERFGLVTTWQLPGTPALQGSGVGGFLKSLDGRAFIAGGDLAAGTQDIALSSLTLSSTAYASSGAAHYGTGAGLSCHDPLTVGYAVDAADVHCVDATWYSTAFVPELPARPPE